MSHLKSHYANSCLPQIFTFEDGSGAQLHGLAQGGYFLVVSRRVCLWLECFQSAVKGSQRISSNSSADSKVTAPYSLPETLVSAMMEHHLPAVSFPLVLNFLTPISEQSLIAASLEPGRHFGQKQTSWVFISEGWLLHTLMTWCLFFWRPHWQCSGTLPGPVIWNHIRCETGIDYVDGSYLIHRTMSSPPTGIPRKLEQRYLELRHPKESI